MHFEGEREKKAFKRNIQTHIVRHEREKNSGSKQNEKQHYIYNLYIFNI